MLINLLVFRHLIVYIVTMATNHNVQPLFSKEVVTARIDELAEEVLLRYADKNPVFVCFLKGGLPFTINLMQVVNTRAEERDLVFHPEVDYMVISTYGTGTKAKEPRIVTDLADRTVVRDRLVVMLDDVLDTGTTMRFAEDHFMALGANGVESIALVQKTGQDRTLYSEATLYGFDSPSDQWLIGMGMNGDPRHPEPEAGRWLGYIASVTLLDQNRYDPANLA